MLIYLQERNRRGEMPLLFLSDSNLPPAKTRPFYLVQRFRSGVPRLADDYFDLFEGSVLGVYIDITGALRDSPDYSFWRNVRDFLI